MLQRGRKSAADLSLVATLPGQRPEPPEKLSDSEAELWCAVVATKPSDWFTPDTAPLLVGYCRVSAYADQLTADMAKFALAPDDDLPSLALKAKLRRGISRERDAQHEKLARLLAGLRPPRI